MLLLVGDLATLEVGSREANEIGVASTCWTWLVVELLLAQWSLEEAVAVEWPSSTSKGRVLCSKGRSSRRVSMGKRWPCGGGVSLRIIRVRPVCAGLLALTALPELNALTILGVNLNGQFQCRVNRALFRIMPILPRKQNRRKVINFNLPSAERAAWQNFVPYTDTCCRILPGWDGS